MSGAPSFAVDPPEGVPARVQLGGQWYRVRHVVDGWVARSRWWEADEERLYARLDTTGPVVDAYRVDGVWHLAKVHD